MSPSPRRRVHCLGVEPGSPVEQFADLFAAAGPAGRRIGWLELDAALPALEATASLGEAATLGALRAVAVGPGGSVAVKPRKGEPVLKDLLREHFAGADLVLIRASREALASLLGEAAPRLVAADAAWTLERPEASPLRLDSASLVARLGRPRPWGD